MFSSLLIAASVGLVLTTSTYITKLSRLIRRLRFRPTLYKGELPTVSVCIPARNETHAMTACLEGVLASDYKKLEIIVIDDSSIDDTSILIKSFAHAGVRFVEGSSLPGGWLGKNHALESLLQEASGKYVLFMDVDTIVESYSISELVSFAASHESKLVSVLPRREDMWRASVIFGSLRYFWALLRDSHRTPAVSSVAWLINRQVLLNLGGFISYRQLVQPEEVICLDIKQQNDQQLIISTDVLGFSYEKKWSSQAETSIRLMKPLIGGDIKSLGAALSLLIYVSFPFLLVLFINDHKLAVIVAFLQLFVTSVLFGIYFKTVWRRGWWLGLFVWPLLLVQEAFFIVVSVMQYKRNRVTWKGRLVNSTDTMRSSYAEEKN